MTVFVSLRRAPANAATVADIAATSPAHLAGRVVSADVPFQFVYVCMGPWSTLIAWVDAGVVVPPGNTITLPQWQVTQD